MYYVLRRRITSITVHNYSVTPFGGSEFMGRICAVSRSQMGILHHRINKEVGGEAVVEYLCFTCSA